MIVQVSSVKIQISFCNSKLLMQNYLNKLQLPSFGKVMEDNCIKPKSVIRPQIVHSYDSMVLFPNIFSFLSTSCLSLQLDVTRYACVLKPNNLLDNKTNYIQALMTEQGQKQVCKYSYQTSKQERIEGENRLF